ncbi:MAG: putative Na+/H+ antiporter [Candidatus Scalindua sp.]|nr:putative Na+/H+ antiporter [Candidatus Scalindua sp.]
MIKMIGVVILFFIIILGSPDVLMASEGVHRKGVEVSFPPKLESYQDGHLSSISEILIHRIHADPLNLVVTLLFLCAIFHTFLACKFTKLAHKIEEQHKVKRINKKNTVQYTGDVVEEVSFLSEIFYFFGEVEVIFGLWVIPVFWVIAFKYGMDNSITYFTHINYTEPLFVVVIMTLAATRPIIKLSEKILNQIARVGKSSPASMWFTVLTVGPVLGSLITEPAAMTISALILAKQFYARKPSIKLAYATIGLLFVNISVGGTISHFAAPPVLMVAEKWDWGFTFMISNFGYKALMGIVIANLSYYFVFRSEFKKLAELKISVNSKLLIKWDMREDPVPLGVTVVHIFFMIWTVYFAHYPPLFVAGFLCFLGFARATEHHQNRTDLKPALLVGFFLAGLVVHGGLQEWWISPILGNLSVIHLMVGSTILSAFNDNASITFLSSLVPNLTDSMKYAVVAGAVSGGGLTLIANAPNPAGQSILQKFFPQGVSPLGIFASALVPTIIMGLIFMLI